MTNFASEDFQVPLQGYCAPGWESVRESFHRNFLENHEIGASLCLSHQGEIVVDLAGGWTDETKSSPFSTDSLVILFSTTKGMTAIAANLLVDRGLLDLSAPVSKYWPEFSKSGKDAATVEMILNHSVGVPGFHEPLEQNAHLNWDGMVDRIEREQPFWEPGVRGGYHALNFGWTAGELVRRVSGESLGTFFQKEIAGPLGADFWIGLPEDQENRVVKVIPNVPKPGGPVLDVYINLVSNPVSISALTFKNSGGFSPIATDDSGEYIINTRAMRKAEIGGAGGVGNARGIAKIYASLLSEDRPLISPNHLARMGRTSMINTLDPVLLIRTQFGLGFMTSIDNRARPLGEIESFVIGEKGFGHVGAGGSFGLADREAGIAIGYAMNRMGAGVLLDRRGQSIIDTVYRKLGYRTSAPGFWIR